MSSANGEEQPDEAAVPARPRTSTGSSTTHTYAEGYDETGQNYDEDRAFLRSSPFTEVTRTMRGWTGHPPAASGASPS